MMKEWLEGLGVSPEAIPEVTATLSNVAVSYAGKVIGVLIILLIALIVAGWVRSLVERALTRVNFDATLTKFFGQMSRWLVLLLAVLGCLGVFGVETTSFAAVIGGASLAIGLAFQGSLSNVAAGVMLLTFRPFTVDQVVVVAGHTGKVDEIGLFMTTLNTFDNRHIIIPNGQVFGSTIVNVTYNEWRRVDVNIGVDYDADIDETRELLRKAGESCEKRLMDRDVVVALTSFGDNSVNWQVRVFAATPDYWDIYEEVMRAIKYTLDDHGIGIPYPQVVVHYADDPAAPAHEAAEAEAAIEDLPVDGVTD